MSMSIRYVGLGVHKDSVVIAVAEADRDRARFFGTTSSEPSAVLRRLRKLSEGGELRCCYEAGPGGYTLQRALTSAWIDCAVIAPSMIPRQPGSRVKTDRLDTENLAHYLRSGDLWKIWVPDADTESVRDLVRLRQS